MNQDFTVQNKAIFVSKKIRAEDFTWKKIPAQAVSEKKVTASWKFPTPPITFLMVRPLSTEEFSDFLLLLRDSASQELKQGKLEWGLYPGYL